MANQKNDFVVKQILTTNFDVKMDDKLKKRMRKDEN